MSGVTLQFRSVGEFLDLNAFTLPAGEDLVDRMTVNLCYYAMNYFTIYAALLLCLSTQHPSFLFATVALSAAGYYLFKMRTDSIVIGQTVLSEDQIKVGFALLSCLLFVYIGGWSIVYVTALAALISLVHALLRQRSVRSRGSVSLAAARDSIKEARSSISKRMS